MREAKERDERATGLKAAGTNPNVVDVAGIARQAQLAAFTATTGDGAREKADTEWLKQLSGDLRKIADDRWDLATMLKALWNEEVVGGAGIVGVAARAVNRLVEFVDTIKAGLKKVFGYNCRRFKAGVQSFGSAVAVASSIKIKEVFKCVP